MFSEATRAKIKKLLRWGKVVAKFAAIGTTVTGAVTAATSTSSTAGFALGAAGATTYAAAKTIPVQGYEKTKHIPPGPPKAAALHRDMKVELMAQDPFAKKMQRDNKLDVSANAPEPVGHVARPMSKAISPDKAVAFALPSGNSHFLARKPILPGKNPEEGFY